MSAQFSRGKFHFEISISIAGRFPTYLRPALTPAAKAVLNHLPIALLRKKLKPGLRYGLSISVVGPAAIHKLNRNYRGKNKPTDVLSFSRIEAEPLLSPEPEIGDVVLCWAIAKTQTKDFGTTRKQEVQRLVVHGVLHLFGYDHENGVTEARRMFRLQEKILMVLT